MTRVGKMMEIMEKRQRLGGLDLVVIEAIHSGLLQKLDNEELEHASKMLDKILMTVKEKGK